MSIVPTINWKSDRLIHDTIGDLEDIKMNILKIALEPVVGKELAKCNSKENQEIEYDNKAISGIIPGSSSRISVDATVAAMCKTGNFPIPKEVAQYIKEAQEEGRVDENELPQSEELFEKGRNILEAFVENGYPYYAACALTGATYVESRWNVHAVNKSELNSKSGVRSTYGWTNCGEGLFQITHWKTKKTVIDTLNPPGVSNNESLYKDARATHLSSLNEEWWAKIAKVFLNDVAKKHGDILINEDYEETDSALTEILSSSYLWKAAPGLDATFDNVKTTAEKYIRTHERQSSNPAHKAHNGFVTQVLTSILLDQYMHGSEFDLDVNDVQNYNQNSFFVGTMIEGDNSYEKVNCNLTSVFANNDNFKANPNGWNLKRACEYIESNAAQSSTHKCAKSVRKAIEYGGISTNGRPTWAWKYINYLPTIGFKFIGKFKRNDPNYVPMPGDIAVYMKNGDPNQYGHICMYSGLNWCSDFRQNSMIVYKGTQYANVFRFSENTENKEKNENMA